MESNLRLMSLGERTELTVSSIIGEKMMNVYWAGENKLKRVSKRREGLREITPGGKPIKGEGDKKKKEIGRSKNQGPRKMVEILRTFHLF